MSAVSLTPSLKRSANWQMKFFTTAALGANVVGEVEQYIYEGCGKHSGIFLAQQLPLAQKLRLKRHKTAGGALYIPQCLCFHGYSGIQVESGVWVGSLQCFQGLRSRRGPGL